MKSRKADRLRRIEEVGPLLTVDRMTGLLRLPPQQVPPLSAVEEIEKESA